MDGYIFYAISFVIFVIFWLKKCYIFWEDRGVKTPPFRYFFGHYYDVFLHRESLPELLLKTYKYLKSKNLVHGGIYSVVSPIYIPVDINIVNLILKADSEHFMSRGMYYNENDDPMGAHLVMLNGPKWKRLRIIYTPTFTSAKLKLMLESFFECANNMENILKKSEGKPLDVKDLVNRFSLDVIANCALGIESNSFEENGNELYDKVGAFFDRTFKENINLFLGDNFPNLMRTLHLRINRREVSEFLMNLIREVIEYREKNNVYRKDFMHSMIQLKNRGKLVDDGKLFSDDVTTDDEENKITFEEICAQTFVFFIGGFESASNTIAYCLYLLSTHKEIQEELRNEIRDVIDKNGGKIDYDAIMEMNLLDKVIKETMRIYPSIPYLFRMCTKDYQIPNTNLILEKGQRVLIPTWGIQTDKDHYPDPENFDPERFSGEKTWNTSTFSPFGDGPRNCLAARFGIMQIKIGLIILLRNNEITLNEKTIIPLQFDTRNALVLSPKGGVWLNFKRIN